MVLSPNADGEFLPARHGVARDFAQIASFEGNCVRLYHPPPAWLLDEAASAGLHVFIDVPWQKHRCFFEDWDAPREAIERVRRTARELGNHPATFAISVANEIPADIVRFYGAARIERFIGDLIDAARQEAPQCLATYSNYPSTEYLCPRGVDFLCFNVYLEEQSKLRPYLDRLQHIAGPLPLMLGEFGLDSMRHGERARADLLAAHVGAVFRHGLAGSFVFSYTDDWFTGGHRIENWAFGITDRDRKPKPAATALQQVWSRVPKVLNPPLPKVSVVVCSYNGDATLEECLRSLQSLDYPSYDVILVDDGSTDSTPQIAQRFPWVRYIHQENRGLSFARNVGAQAASGAIVAYTDSDCVADEKWLHYLISAMLDQQVEAIGGPNVPPPSDGWTAQCVAASPGGPSHVMLDDRFAEHVPGCNMAFDRQKLLDLGGFDAQFGVAGDDVDICWRFIDQGMRIGYAPAALVWHHRRSTVGAYLRQQKGYGRSEAMVYFKHPARFNAAGQARWNGVIYGDGAVGLPLAPQKTWHGRFGSGLFQVIYRHNQYSLWSWPTLLEWHIVAGMLLAMSPLFRPLVALPAGMWLLSLAAAGRSAIRAPLPNGSPRWCRPLVMLLHLLQPAVRSWHRYKLRLATAVIPSLAVPAEAPRQVKRIARGWRDMYWRSIEGRGRHQILEALVAAATSVNWPGDFHAQWEPWDLMLLGGPWHKIQIRTASEELGGPKLFTRVRWRLSTTRPARIILAALGAFTVAATFSAHRWPAVLAAGAVVCFITVILNSRHRCSRAIAALVWKAAHDAGLEPVTVRESIAVAELQPARNGPKAAVRTVPAEVFSG
jgi:O-antigen biosynthesis protein